MLYKLKFLIKNFILENFNIIRGNNNKFVVRGMVYKLKKDIRGNDNQIFIGSNSVLKNCKIFIRGNNNKISIASNVNLQNVDLWIEDSTNLIKLGKGTTIESGHLAVTEDNKSIEIGENCMFSTNITIRTGDSHSIISNETNVRINYADNVLVGNSVWIGANATILKGSVIGDEVIVGTGAIVNGKFESNVIIAGIPAKIVKKEISWKRERI